MREASFFCGLREPQSTKKNLVYIFTNKKKSAD